MPYALCLMFLFSAFCFLYYFLCVLVPALCLLFLFSVLIICFRFSVFYIDICTDLSFLQKYVNTINNEIVVTVRVRDAFVPADGWLFLAAGTGGEEWKGVMGLK
jgi:hypothetical protein